MPHCLSLSRKE